MLRSLRAPAAAVLLLLPTGLAFAAGGFFDEPRLLAGVLVWLIVLAVALGLGRVPLRGAGPRLALSGLAALTLLTGLSLLWAPLSSAATDDLQRLLLYLGALIAAAALLGEPRIARTTPVVLASGAAVVVVYALSGRVLGGLIRQAASRSSAARLEQPLSYWNSMGLLAAMGLVLCAGVAGDPSRSLRTRAAMTALAVPMGAAVYLSFSRGALLAVAVGLAAVVLVAWRSSELRSAAICLALGVGAALVCVALPALRDPIGDVSDRLPQGLVGLALFAALAAIGAVATWRLSDRPSEGLPRAVPRRGLAAALAAVVVVGLVGAGVGENRAAKKPVGGAENSRLLSVDSSRPDYWRVAARAAGENPLAGVGSGGFRAEWLAEREVPEAAADAHSLYLEVLAELGLLGVAALVAAFAGVAVSARAALRAGAPVAAASGALMAWAVASAMDWHWEMPAVTLIALLLAGMLCGAVPAPNGPVPARAA